MTLNLRLGGPGRVASGSGSADLRGRDSRSRSGSEGGCFPGNDTGFPGDVPDPTRPPTRPRAPRTSQLLLTIYMLRRTHSYRLRACPKEGKIAIVCAQVMACACSASLVSHRLCFIHSHPHSYSIARSSRMPWRRCSRPARATAPRTFTHGPVGRGSQASPPACMPCNVLSLAPSLPRSPPLWSRR